MTTKKPTAQVKSKLEFIEQFAEPLREMRSVGYDELTPAFPDTESEFIHELSGLIRKWKGRPGNEAISIAAAYKNMLNQLLSPDTE